MNRVTQRKIAIHLGLTQATVSLALRNNPRIPEARRAMIQRVAEEMGYHPSPAASVLAQLRHTPTERPRRAALAWLNFWRESKDLRRHSEFDLYFQGAAAAAEKFGFYLEDFHCGEEMRVERMESILLARGIEGVFLPPHRRIIDLSQFRWNHFSVIKFGRSLSTPNVHSVTADQVHNSITAFREIRAKGYRRIGMVDSRRDHWLFDAGFLKAQLEVKKTERVPIHYLSPQKPERGSDIHKQDIHNLKRWLDRTQPDAIFTSTQRLIPMLQDLGLSVPGNIPVAGASLMDCQVDAGMDQNAYEIGRVAMLTMISHLHNNDRGVPLLYRETLVKGHWIDGSSMPQKEKKGKC